MNTFRLPQDLRRVIGDEKIEFSVFAKRKQPKQSSYGTIIFALLWLTIPSIASYIFFKPLFVGEEVHFEVDDVPTTASWDDFEPMLIPSLLLILFLVIGIAVLIGGLISLFKKGGYYVGTKTRLINYRKGMIKYYDWEQFTGNIEVNFKKKNISLEMRRGRMRHRDDRSDEFVPEVLHLSGIEDIVQVERICRERIKENDPTPVIQNT